MPVVSPGRFPSSSASSISSSPFRSTSSYYSSATGTYIAPRPTHRSNFSDRSSSSVSDYRTHSRFTSYDSDGVRERKSSYASDYRCVRAPSISDSDSGISNMSRFTNRSERSTSRSRDTSVARSDSARTTRSESTSNSILSMSTADMFLKYSPDNYIPAVQRLSSAAAATNGDSLRSGKSYSRDATRLPPPRRTTRNTEDDEVKQRSKSDTNNTPRPMKRQTNSTVVKQCVHSHKSVECVTNNSGQQADPLKRDVECAQRNRTARTTVAAITKSRPWFDRKTESCRDTTLLSDDNGNDLQVSVAEIRRKFDNKMPVTRLPAHEPFSSSHYKTTRSSDNIYKQTNNLNNGVSSFSEDKPVPVHRPTTSDKYANGTTGSLKWEFSSPSSSSGYDSKESGYSIKRSTEPGSDISTIYIACKSNGSTSDTNPVNSVKSQLNSNANAKILEKSTTVYVGNGDVKVNGTTNHKTNSTNVLNIEIGNSSKSTEKQSPPKKTAVTISNHTSDFASYIQMSAPVKNNSSSDNDSKDAELNNGPASPKNANGEETDASKLRFIDSEPNSESDSRQTIECNGKTNHNDAHDDEEQENGFENKTFEHENGRLLMRKRVEENVGRLPNGLGSRGSEDSDSSDCEPKEELESVKASNSEGDALNRNDAVTIKASSPVNSISSIIGNSSPCGSLTTGRRRSIDLKSVNQNSQTTEQFSKTSGLNGLRNIGNTCFMNSVVQCLSNTRPLLEYSGNPEALTPDINTTLSCMKGALIKAFSQVICELWKAGEQDSVVNTTALKAQIQRFAPRFMGYSQQDAQEFLRYLLEGLHEDVNRVTVKPKPILSEIDDNLSDAQKAQESWQRYLRMEDSRVSDIFVGQLKSSLRCTHCSHTSVTFDPFWDLSLPIPNRTGQLKLTQCLSHFTREEEMDGDEKPTCSKCQTRRKCLKWFTVQKFPQVLVLHLKRFSPTERFRGKLNVPVEFPLTGLNMSAYAATPCAKPPVYNLYAISNHSGTTYSGHYTAYCKHPYNGEWHEYNDSRVSSISSKSVVSSEAYVLFYELAGSSSSSSS